MPRLFHKPPKYRRHNSTKQAVVSFRSEVIFLGPYGSRQSHAKYQDVLKLWHEDRHNESGPKDAPSPSSKEAIVDSVTTDTLRQNRSVGAPVTVNELVLVYRRHTYQYYRKNGEITREATIIDDVLRFLRKHHGTTYLDKFGPVALAALREGMISDLDWSRKHLNKQVRRLVAMFTWAAGQELVDPSVPVALKSLSGLKKGRTTARESEGVVCVDDAVVDATLQHLPEIIADVVRLQRLTGARPSEICDLRPCDIDRTGDVWLYVPAAHKTEHHDKDRVIAIGPKSQKVLRPYLLRPSEAYCFSPKESEIKRRERAAAARKTPDSCGNRRGTNRVKVPKRKAADHYTTDSYRRAIHRVCKKHGIERWAPNRLRHTAATSIRKRFGIEAAQVMCGHENADVTQIYAERNLDLAIQVAREAG